MPEYDDATLERIMRTGLELRASDAADELVRPLPVASRRPSSGRWVAVAAAVVLLAVAGVAVRSSRDSGSPGPVAVDPGGPTAGWRVESYAGVQLRVPPDWGLGGSPHFLHIPGQGLQVCDDHLSGAAPFVGRPVLLSDLCTSWSVADGPAPKADTVWFGSPVDLGTTQIAGRTAETVAVGRQHVTVFSENVALRVQILDSAAPVAVDDNGCPTKPVDQPSPGAASLRAAGLSVCAYDAGTLLWSGEADAEAARSYVDAYRTGSASFDVASACNVPPDQGQYVALGISDARGGPQRWDIVSFDCDRILSSFLTGDGTPSPSEGPLVPATIEPWALPGIKAYVPGPADPGDLAPYFRGMLG